MGDRDDKHNDSEVNRDDKVTIKIPKGNGKSDTSIKGSINGMAYEVAVDQEVSVPREVAEAIGDNGIEFEVVDGEGAGLPSPSTAPLTDTATRLETNIKAEDAVGGGNGPSSIPTLEGGEGDSGTGTGSAAPADVDPNELEGQRNAEGQGAASGSQTDDGNKGGDTSGEGDADDKADEGEKPETVDALKERIAKIDDLDALQAEHDAEEKGRKRTTALAAIHSRMDEVREAE